MKVLVTGALGQDGRLMTDLYERIGGSSLTLLSRSIPSTLPGDKVHNFVQLDIRNETGLSELVAELKPDIIYHFAAMSSVARSWEAPGETFEINTQGTLNLLEAVRRVSPHSRVVLAGSSEIFARGLFTADENAPISPSSPYGVSKSTNLELGRIYREVHGLAISTAIMFNHESNLRQYEYVSKEIAVQAARIKMGLQECVVLRDLESSKDWGWSPEFVEGLHKLGHSEFSGDLVFSTGVRSTVRGLAEAALKGLDLDVSKVVQNENTQSRPNDKTHPVGDSSRAKKLLGWSPKVLPEEFMAMMARQALIELDQDQGSQSK